MNRFALARAPKFITLTGVDERTDLRRLVELSERYLVEFALLVGDSRNGTRHRYPSFDFLQKFVRLKCRKALHLCGQYAAAINSRSVGPVRWIYPLLRDVDRIQVNSREPITEAIEAMLGGYGVQTIAQCRGDQFPRGYSHLSWLFDRSGGRGVAPESWPPFPGRLVGYAGGIGLDNIASVIEAINADGGYWLDMETSLRTPDDWFDLDKCELILQAVYGDGQ